MADDSDYDDPDNPAVTLRTTKGDITLELFEQRAPRTVENFLGLSQPATPSGATPKPARRERTPCTRAPSSTGSSAIS